MRKILLILGIGVGVWLGGKYLLPLLLPFLLGGLVALSAQPLVQLGQKKLGLGRPLAAGLGVSVTLLLLGGIVSLVGAVAIKELGRIAGTVPDLETTARQSMGVLENWLLELADRTPAGVQPAVKRTVHNAFEDSAMLMDQVTARVPQAVGNLLSRVPDGALGVGTGILSAYMISVRLPAIRNGLQQRLPVALQERGKVTLEKIRTALRGWLRAQGKLMLLTYGVVSLGFLLLKIPYGLVWAALLTLVDAVPMLGTGIVLLPWALACLLQGQQLRALILVLIFGAATLVRTVMEPKLVGKQLGLDPLLALLALYVGYQLWGFVGLLTAPMLASITKSLLDTKN